MNSSEVRLTADGTLKFDPVFVTPSEIVYSVLESAVVRDPYDRDLLSALAAYDRAAGRVADSQRWARRLSELEAADR